MTRARNDIRIAICPTCKKENVTPAHILGHCNKGSKKPFSKEHRAFLSRQMKRIQRQREVDRHLAKVTGVRTEK